MKKALKIICAATLLVFAFAGASSATLIDDLYGGVSYVFLEPDPDGAGPLSPTQEWATLTVTLTPKDSAGNYTYNFVLEVTGPYSSPIHQIDLPVAAGSIVPGSIGQADPQDFFDSVASFDVSFEAGGYLSVIWAAEAITTTLPSSAFFFQSPNDPQIGIATIWDTGGTTTGKSASALGGVGGGGSTTPVPEPATLLLLGSGMLGTGAFRYLRSRRNSK